MTNPTPDASWHDAFVPTPPADPATPPAAPLPPAAAPVELTDAQVAEQTRQQTEHDRQADQLATSDAHLIELGYTPPVRG